MGRPVSKTINIAEAFQSPVSTHYRSISILPPFSEVLEKLVYNQLYDFLEKHNNLHRYQFGFRKGHSTEQAIFEIIDAIKQAMDKKLFTCELLDDKASYHLRLFGFYLFIFSLYLFLSSFLCAAVFRLLPSLFRVEEFARKRKRRKNYLPWTSKGWKGKFCSSFGPFWCIFQAPSI